MPSTSSTTPVLSSSGVSQPDNAGVTAKESDTDLVLLSMKFCFSAPPLTLFTLQWAYTMLLSPPLEKFWIRPCCVSLFHSGEGAVFGVETYISIHSR